MNIVVQGVTEKIVGGDIAYRFSEHAVNLIRRGEATIAIHRETGKYLPFIQDGSGKIIEHARGIVSLAPKLAQLASLGVAAAHLVAGYDLAKRVKFIQQNVEFLVASRQIDQEASVKSSFLEARELLLEPLTESSLVRLKEIRHILARRRMEWLGEIAFGLKPASKIAPRKFWNFGERRSNRSIEKQILKGGEATGQKLSAVGSALMIDAMLAFSTGTADTFQSNVLAREESEWEELRLTALRAAAKFHDKRKAESMRIADGIAGYVSVVQTLRSGSDSAKQVLPPTPLVLNPELTGAAT